MGFNYGETLNVNYISGLARNVRVDLYDGTNNVLVGILATSTPMTIGTNVYKWNIPAWGISNTKSSSFYIMVTDVNAPSKVVSTETFQVLPSYIQVTDAWSKAGTGYYSTGGVNKEFGVFTQILNVSAKQGDAYVHIGVIPSYAIVATSSMSSSTIMNAYFGRYSFDQGATSTQNSSVIVIPKVQTVQFVLTVQASAVIDGSFKLKTNNIYYGQSISNFVWWTNGFQNIQTPSLSLKTIADPIITSSTSGKVINYLFNNQGVGIVAYTNFGVTLNNISNHDIYISKTPSLMVASSSTVTGHDGLWLTSITTTSATIPGDTANFYVIPAGLYRSFSMDGDVTNYNGNAFLQQVKITKIFYSDTTNSPQKYFIDRGLENLSVTVKF